MRTPFTRRAALAGVLPALAAIAARQRHKASHGRRRRAGGPSRRRAIRARARDEGRPRHARCRAGPIFETRANISNPHTRRAYENAVKDFMRFAGIRRPEEFRVVTRGASDRLARRAAPASSAARPSDTVWRRSPRCSSISARRMPSPTIRPKASSGRRPRAAKARRLRSAIIRRTSCSRRPARTPSRASVIVRSCRSCCSRPCAARNDAS